MKPIRLIPISESIHTDKALHVNAKRLIETGSLPDEEVEMNQSKQNSANRLRTIASTVTQIRNPKIPKSEIEQIGKFSLS
jgi:hypothetical protein